MNKQINEQTTQNSQAVITDTDCGDDKTEVSFGKFKDVNALLSAYNSLQAEFTKRCQRIKELESANLNDKATDTSLPNSDLSSTPLNFVESQRADGNDVGITDFQKEQIVKGYLKNLLSAKQQAIIMDGSGVGIKTPYERPKNLSQAAEYAKQLFKN